MSSTSRSHNLLLALFSIATVLLVVEIALRVFAPFPNPYAFVDVNQYIRFQYPRNYAAVTEVEPGLPGTAGIHHFTTNNMGFRGGDLVQPRPADEYRIFLVGGSTFECFYLDDRAEIGRVLQDSLPPLADGRTARVYNVGLSGAASDDHIAMIGQRLVHLQPDLIVVFAGVNDLTRSIFDYDYLHYDAPPKPSHAWYKTVAMNFQLVRRLHRLVTKMVPDARTIQESRTLVSNYARQIALQRTGVPATTPPRVDRDSYATNLRTMIGMAREVGSSVVFMTQQTTWNSPVDADAREWSWMRYRAGITYSEADMDAAMDSLNDVMRQVAEESHVPVFDLARWMPKSLEYFYDDCHFTPAGAAAAGTRLAEFLVGQQVVPPAR
ncbi:MAG TPA: SGNH/GDSL hydrolase family protein [Candidatus Krumholzibacteria bacterium]|nr:SGNH/GDSL hydrolase family protein [Candidatus Krumholzibacteria bacterium]